MGLWRNLALINLTNPNALSQDVKNALQAKWEYEVTHPKKKSGIGGAIGKVVSAVAPVAGLATAGLIQPKKIFDTAKKAKGSIGGGSYTEAVKNPLGGSAGKTGR